MNVVKETAKTKEDALKQVLTDLNASEEEVAYSFTEIKGGLFKGVTYECSGFLKSDILNEVQEYLKGILTGMGLEVSFEINTKEGVTTIKMYTSNNPIIIGKNGKMLKKIGSLARLEIENLLSKKVYLELFVKTIENWKNKEEIFEYLKINERDL